MRLTPMMQPLCFVTDIPENSAKGFEMATVSLFVVHAQGAFFAYLNDCPHRGIRLDWQPDQFLDHERNFIQCATHGALFTLDQGECIAGPCPGETLNKLPCDIRDGVLWVKLPTV